MDYPVPYQAVSTPGISSPQVGTADGLLFVCLSEAQIPPMEPDPWFGMNEWEDIFDEWELMGESEDFEPQVVVPKLTDRVFIGPFPKLKKFYWNSTLRDELDEAK